MITDSISLPHPALGISDDIAGSFSIELNVKRNAEKRTIDFEITDLILDNRYFAELIQNNKAKVILKIYCSSTLKTWAYYYGDNISINEHDLCNKVEIEPSIIAVEDINDYYDYTFHPQYDNKVFSVKKFERIALLGMQTVPIDKNYEKLGLGNIFQFQPQENDSNPCYFDLTGDKIVIHYPLAPNGDHIPNVLFNKNRWAAYNMFIVPALTEAFRLMQTPENADDISSFEWYYVIDSLLPNTERDDDPYINAQLILDKELPIIKAYEELNN